MPSKGRCACLPRAFLPLPRRFIAFPFEGPSALPSNAFAFQGHLPSKALCPCHRKDLSFIFEGPFLRRDIAFDAPMPQEVLCLFLRRVFAFKGPSESPGICLRGAFALKKPLHLQLPSKGLFLDAKAPHIMLQIASWDTFAIKGPLPLPSKGFCPQRALLAFYFNHCKILRHRLLLMQHPRTQTYQARLE